MKVVDAQPVIVQMPAGRVHRANLDADGRPIGHTRCRIDPDKAVVLGRSLEELDVGLGELCHYPWCFAEEFERRGINPHVGRIGGPPRKSGRRVNDRRPPAPASPGAPSDEGDMPGTRLPASAERDPVSGRLVPKGSRIEVERVETITTPLAPPERRQATEEERKGFRPAAWTETPGDTVTRIRSARRRVDPVAKRIVEALAAAPAGTEDPDGHLHVGIRVPVAELEADPSPASAWQPVLERAEAVAARLEAEAAEARQVADWIRRHMAEAGE